MWKYLFHVPHYYILPGCANVKCYPRNICPALPPPQCFNFGMCCLKPAWIQTAKRKKTFRV